MDIRDPSDSYSAAQFAADADRLCAELIERGHTPLLVGGTMLYFRAFLQGMAAMPPADPQVRAGIQREAAERGWPHIHRQLAAVDPVAAARIHPNHSQRLARALEVYRSSGVCLSEWQRGPAGRPLPAERFRIVQMAICPADRAVLHERIAQRFRLMLDGGLLEEVRGLHGRPDLHPGLPAIRSVGYRQLWRHLDGEIAWEEAVDQAIAATRQLAKRQLTWLRKWPDLNWIYTDCEGNVVESAESAPAGQVRAGTRAPADSALNAALNFLACDSM